jgi:hypothetical protein
MRKKISNACTEHPNHLPKDTLNDTVTKYNVNSQKSYKNKYEIWENGKFIRITDCVKWKQECHKIMMKTLGLKTFNEYVMYLTKN